MAKRLQIVTKLIARHDFFARYYKAKKISIFSKELATIKLHWGWRRVVSLALLVTFPSTLLTPALASSSQAGNKQTIPPGFKIKSAPNKNKAQLASNNLRALAPTPKVSDYITIEPPDKLAAHALEIPLKNNHYKPYLELGGAKYFNQNSNVAGIYDLFIPLFQTPDQLFFTDLRIFDRSGSAAEGNLHLGYRKLYPHSKQMLGIYGAFDLKRSDSGNSYKQIMLGLEYWHDQWFLGANIYKPLTTTHNLFKENALPLATATSRGMVNIKHYEKALGGGDAEVGYAFSDNLTWYVGGYYFHASDAGTIAGPKSRVTYNYEQPVGRILGVLDGIRLEAGVQHDKTRGTTAYLGIKFKVGLTSQKNHSSLLGFEQHMTELVRRDPDIVIGQFSKLKEKFYQPGAQGFWEGDNPGGDGNKRNNNQGNKGGGASEENINFTGWDIKDLLKELGLPSNATLTDVKKRYRELMLKAHPDRGGATKDAKRINNIKDAILEKKDKLSKEVPKSQPANSAASDNYAAASTTRAQNFASEGSPKRASATSAATPNFYQPENQEFKDSSKRTKHQARASLDGCSNKYQVVGSARQDQSLFKPQNPSFSARGNQEIETRLKPPAGKTDYHTLASSSYINTLPVTRLDQALIQEANRNSSAPLLLVTNMVVRSNHAASIPKENRLHHMHLSQEQGNKAAARKTNQGFYKQGTYLIGPYPTTIWLGSKVAAQDSSCGIIDSNEQEFFFTSGKLIPTANPWLLFGVINNGDIWPRGPPAFLCAQFLNKLEHRNFSSYRENRSLCVSPPLPMVHGIGENQVGLSILVIAKDIIIAAIKMLAAPLDQIFEVIMPIKGASAQTVSDTEELNLLPKRPSDKEVSLVKELISSLSPANHNEVNDDDDISTLIAILKDIDANPNFELNEIQINLLEKTLKESPRLFSDKQLINLILTILTNNIIHCKRNSSRVIFVINVVKSNKLVVGKLIIDRLMRNIDKIKVWYDPGVFDNFTTLLSSGIGFGSRYAICPNINKEYFYPVNEEVTITTNKDLQVNYALVVTLVKAYKVLGYLPALDVVPQLAATLENTVFKDETVSLITASLISSLNSGNDWHKVTSHTDNLLNNANSLPLELAVAIIKAAKIGYRGSIKLLIYFEKLLDNVSAAGLITEEEILGFLIDSLPVLLRSPEFKPYFCQLEKIINKVATKIEPLPLGLIQAIFEAYSKDQEYFTDIVVTILAENNNLAVDLLAKLIDSEEPLVNIADTKATLFIALRLIQNHINLPPEPTLHYFINFLFDTDEVVRLQAINLYHQLNYLIPVELMLELGDALVTLLPKISDLQQAKVEDILEKIELTKEQQVRLDIQRQVIAWNTANNLAEKHSIMMGLYNKITNNTPEELISFFKQTLASQNSLFLRITKDALEKIAMSQELVWDPAEKELLPLLKVSDSWFPRITKYINGVGSYEVGNGGEILVNNKQEEALKALIKAIGWDIAKYFKQIIFVNFSELYKFLTFVKDTGLSNEELSRVLNTYSSEGLSLSSDVPQLYTELLQNLLKVIELPLPHNRNKLRHIIEGLLGEPNWPADFLFSLIKKAMATNNIHVMLQSLELLNSYKNKINPASIDRNGNTALAILAQNTFPDMLPLIERLRRDNSYFVETEVEFLLQELKELNPEIPDKEIEDLIWQFMAIFYEMLDIREDWSQSRYRLKTSRSKPVIVEGYLYLYALAGKACLATTEKEVCSADDKYQELEQLKSFIAEDATDNFLIYEQAIKLEMVPKLKGIAKPLIVWNGADELCEKSCESAWQKRKAKDYAKYKACRKHCDKNNHFIRWFQSYKNIDQAKKSEFIAKNMAEVLAVLSQVIFNIEGFYPRPVQLLALFLLLNSDKGRLAQIATGEGKSLIIFMLAVIKVMEGGQVDILTSSYELAIRDSLELKRLYGQFGIGVSNNVRNIDLKAAIVPYDYDVVYGDPSSFVADILRDSDSKVRKERGLHYIVVDEVDSMFYDNNEMLVLLASLIPGFDIFNLIFSYMYGTVREIAPLVEDYKATATANQHEKQSGCYLKQSVFKAPQKQELVHPLAEALKNSNEDNNPENIRLGDTCFNFIKDYMSGYVKKLLGLSQLKEDRLVIIPHYLENITEGQIDNWVKSLLMSFSLEKNVDYIIKDYDGLGKGKDKYKTIEIVDSHNTGTIMYGLQWENALHQFLQITNSLTVIPENIVSIFMSYFRFFSLYKKIYGLTGTLGSGMHREFLKDVYGVESIIVPPFIRKDLIEFPIIFAASKEEWQEEIINSVYHNSQRCSRATLVIVDTIKEVDDLSNKLANKYPELHIITYSIGGKVEAEIIKGELKPGDVVIATNIGGRGTDLKINSKVKKHGGLHVIKTSFSKSIRVERQALGRGARKGDPGSAQLIINLQQLPTNCEERVACLNKECDSYTIRTLRDCIYEEREENENLSLLEDKLVRVRYMMIRDDIYNSFVALRKEMESPTGYKLLTGVVTETEELEDLTLNIYKEESKLKLKIVNKEKTPQVIDVEIAPLVRAINPQAEKQIEEILSNSNNTVASFSYLEYAIIQFIAASLGYSNSPEIYNQVAHDFVELLLIFS